MLVSQRRRAARAGRWRGDWRRGRIEPARRAIAGGQTSGAYCRKIAERLGQVAGLTPCSAASSAHASTSASAAERKRKLSACGSRGGRRKASHWSKAAMASIGASRQCRARAESGEPLGVGHQSACRHQSRRALSHVVHWPRRRAAHIGYATSADGKTWRRMSDKPVLSPDKPWEKVAVMCPHVLWDADAKQFRMWYSGGEQYEPECDRLRFEPRRN